MTTTTTPKFEVGDRVKISREEGELLGPDSIVCAGSVTEVFRGGSMFRIDWDDNDCGGNTRYGVGFLESAR